MPGREPIREGDWAAPRDIAQLVRLLLRPAAGAKDRYEAAAGRVEAALEKLDAVSAPPAASALVEEAERKGRVLFGVAHARLCSSLSKGMELPLKLSGLKPGDELILPPTAALASVLYPLSIGARLVFTDPDPEAIESRVAPRTRAIIVVHAAGFPADVDPVMRIATAHSLTVIEAAEGGMGARYKGKYLGTIGHFGCVSASVADGGHALGENALLLSGVELGRAEEGVLYDRFGQLQIPEGEGPTAAHATLAHFEESLRLLPDRADSEHSWSVSRSDIEAGGYDLKAVNPNRKLQVDERTPQQILDQIEARGRDVAAALAALRGREPSSGPR